MELFSTVVGLGVPFLLGSGLLGLMWPKEDPRFFPFEKFFLSFGLGFGFLTLGMFIFSLIGFKFNIWFFSILSIGFFWAGRSSLFSCQKPNSLFCSLTQHPLLLLLYLGIILNLAQVLVRSMLVDIDMWDSWAFWAFKAKIFFIHGTIPFDLFNQFKQVWGNWDYPLDVPLMETWVLLWLGYWNDLWPRIIFPLFYGGIIVLGFCFLRRRVSLPLALFGTFLLAGFPALQTYTIGTIAEPVFLFYYLASLILLFRWYEDKDVRYLLLSAVYGGLALWTKSETVMHMAGNLFLLGLMLWRQPLGRVVKYFGIYFFVLFIIPAPWNVYKVVAHLPNAIFNAQYFDAGHWHLYGPRIFNMYRPFLYHFIDFNAWNMLWLLFGTAMVLNLIFSSGRGLQSFLLFAIFFQWVCIAFVYVTWPFDGLEFVKDTMLRLMLSSAILSILYSILSIDAIGNYRFWK